MSWFQAAATGEWCIEHITPIIGATLPPAAYLTRIESAEPVSIGPPAAWVLQGMRSNQRYTQRAELDRLTAVQAELGRPEATRAALIPIKKTAAWWQLAQDERRAIFEDTSRHIAIGLDYLPAIARRLYHSRDLGEPFDFLTWFEFAPRDSAQFDDLVARLRATEEWRYIEREVDVRVARP